MSENEQSPDYYSILGADENATPREIERHYRRKAVRHHPDLGGDEEDMKALNEAYGVLKDSAQRRAYDCERQKEDREADRPGDSDSTAHTSTPVEVDAITHQVLIATIFIVLGLVLLFVVRFQYVIFLWPLALLAVFMILVGIVQAHGVFSTLRRKIVRAYPKFRFGLVQEAVFWVFVVGGGYGVYLLLASD
jgi:curved DNA-binding protein CbpA